MKRLICALLCLCILLSFTACGDRQESRCTFYYLRSDNTIQYGQTDALIAPVEREFSYGELSLDELLQLYLNGPTEEDYRNIIPKGTYLLSTIQRTDLLVVVLSREFSTLDGIQLTLAGACLTATCHALTGLERIQVRSGESIYDFDLNDCIFLDDGAGK